jgi:hypothetical protein
MIEVFELVLRELLIGRNNLVDLDIRVIEGFGYHCMEVSLYFRYIDRYIFWHDLKVIREDVLFYYRGLSMSMGYSIRTRFLQYEG